MFASVVSPLGSRVTWFLRLLRLAPASPGSRRQHRLVSVACVAWLPHHLVPTSPGTRRQHRPAPASPVSPGSRTTWFPHRLVPVDNIAWLPRRLRRLAPAHVVPRSPGSRLLPAPCITAPGSARPAWSPTRSRASWSRSCCPAATPAASPACGALRRTAASSSRARSRAAVPSATTGERTSTSRTGQQTEDERGDG